MSLALYDFRLKQRDYLLSIGRALVSNLSLRATLQLILRAAVDMLQGPVGLIALYHQQEEASGFSYWASYGLPPAMVEVFTPLLQDLPVHPEPETWTLSVSKEQLDAISAELGQPLRQALALPMIWERTLVGVIFIFRTHPLLLTPDDRQILAGFTDFATIAVRNARLYEELLTERWRLDALLESSGEGILVLRPDLTIERMNAAATQLTGWGTDQAVGRPHDEVLVWTQITRGQPLTQALAQGWPERGERVLYVEGELKRRNGALLAAAVTYAPLKTRAGRLLNIVVNLRNISAYREAETLKDTFISIVSHELKTPVAIIRGYAETLSRPEAQQNPELVQEMLEGILEESDRLTHLVDDLLDASRLRANGLPLEEVEEVHLPGLARCVQARYQPQSTRHTIEVDFPPDFPLIRGSAARLEQVLNNLVSNALKYSPNGGTIRLRGEYDAQGVLLSVSDEGIGIPPEEQERIFERFYRVTGPQTRAIAGTGLGLYLTRAIVQAHGGRIWVESRPGQGATFYVRLPFQTDLAQQNA